MSTCFEMAITFSHDVLRRRDLAGSKAEGELRLFYMFIAPERPVNAFKKSKSIFSNPHSRAQPRRAAGGHTENFFNAPDALTGVFLWIVCQACGEAPWFLTLEKCSRK